MKNTIWKTAATGLGALLLAGCAKDPVPAPAGQGAKLAIAVTAGGFADAEVPQSGNQPPGTRATDQYYHTWLDSGDLIGLVEVKDGVILENNILVSHILGGWELPDGIELWYQEGTEYVAYYPYDPATESVIASAPEKTGTGIAAAIAAAFEPRPDQSTYAAYTASDLMIWSGRPVESVEVPRLDIQLEHAMSLVVLSPGGFRGNPVSDAELRVTSDGTDYVPYAMLTQGNSTDPNSPAGNPDGTWRVLVKPGMEVTASARYRSAGVTFEWNTPAPFIPESAQYRKFNLENNELQVDYSDEQIPAEGGFKIITIRSDGKWTVSKRGEDTSWYEVDVSSGTGDGTVTVTIDRTSRSVERSGAVVIHRAGREQAVPISQAAPLMKTFMETVTDAASPYNALVGQFANQIVRNTDHFKGLTHNLTPFTRSQGLLFAGLDAWAVPGTNHIPEVNGTDKTEMTAFLSKHIYAEQFGEEFDLDKLLEGGYNGKLLVSADKDSGIMIMGVEETMSSYGEKKVTIQVFTSNSLRFVEAHGPHYSWDCVFFLLTRAKDRFVE